jgi:hypothetical protein
MQKSPAMSKYDSLEPFLLAQNKSLIRTTFDEIEKVIGHPLPSSAKYPAWWSNNPTNNAMTKIWRRAGYRTEQVDIARKTLVFRRVPPPAPTSSISEEQHQNNLVRLKNLVSVNQPSKGQNSLAESGRAFQASHPLRGALKGVLRLVGGTDLAQPADPKWGDA